MERGFVLVLVALAMLNQAQPAEDNTTTLEELFLDKFGVNVHQILLHNWLEYSSRFRPEIRPNIEPFSGKATLVPLTTEILKYIRTIQFKIMSEMESDLANVTLESIYKDINDHCAEYLETPIEDLTIEPSNVTCMYTSFRKSLTLKIKMDIELGLQKLSRACSQHLLPLCSGVHDNCTLAYEERVGKLLTSYIHDTNEVLVLREIVPTPVDAIVQFLIKTVAIVSTPYTTAHTFFAFPVHLLSSVSSIEPFALDNLLHPRTNNEVETAYFKTHSTTQSEKQLTWGIVRSSAGNVNHPCSHYKDIYPLLSDEYVNFLNRCYFVNIFHINLDLIRCASTDPTSPPLTWSTAPSAYFHSQCLCLAYNGTECGVKAPRGVDPLLYCLSVLLRDFQRQVTYRPAVTYLDYAFQTRVPVCQLTNLLQIGFQNECGESLENTNFHFILSVQCYFKDLVNKHLNCSKGLLVNTSNHTVLCALVYFMQFVVCDGDVEFPVPYYGAGGSSLVLVLTYLDVAVRVLSLVTYLACPQLRNLPGKLLIGYQVTALLRLLVVRASLADMALAVRLDVAMDLASTLWLTSYLHFLTTSIMALRLPDSLSRDEARMVLLRYVLLGWALPAALSAAFFGMDDALDSRVQFGQLLFVLCNYVALFGNLYMFYKNCQFYYDVKKNALKLREGVTVRSVFADLFNFALKTSLLSGAGITFRLVFTQIQGLEHLLGYYHVLGTLQGLLFFVLYGCNREARVFWKLVFFSILPLCTGRQHNSA